MLDLLVPDLIVPADAPAALREVRLPHLERWLVRGELTRGSARSAIEALASAYGLQAPVPYAPIALAGEDNARGGPGHDGWLRMDPVHLRVDRDSVTLHPPSMLEVQPLEAQRLAAQLAAHFAGQLELHVASPERWYARVAPADLPVTTPLEQAWGRNVFGLLPRSGSAMPWSAMLTEAQMLLSTSEVNQAREGAGRPPINSVWFWGEGIAPASLTRAYGQVHADDPFARGLARLSGARTSGLPADPRALDIPARGEAALVVLPRLSAPMAGNDVQGWLAAARQLDEQWFAHLGPTIERFEAVRLVLPAAHGSRIANLTPRSKLRWYRRAKPLAHHA